MWHPTGSIVKELCLPMFILCHGQRAYPRACLPHVSLNELLEAQEAREMDGMKEEDGDEGKEKEREYMRLAV